MIRKAAHYIGAGGGAARTAQHWLILDDQTTFVMRNIARGVNGDHAGMRLGAGGVNREDSRMGTIRKAYLHPQLACDVYISRISRLACNFAECVLAKY